LPAPPGQQDLALLGPSAKHDPTMLGLDGGTQLLGHSTKQDPMVLVPPGLK